MLRQPNINPSNPQEAITQIREVLRQVIQQSNDQQQNIQQVNKDVQQVKLVTVQRPDTIPQVERVAQQVVTQQLTGDVTGLLGLLSQPQHPFVPSYANATPLTTDPNIQLGTLFIDYTTQHLWWVDDTSEPLTYVDLTSMGGTTAFAKGTHAARPAASASNTNTLYFETDRQWLYYSDGSAWKYITGLYQGTRATRVGIASLGTNDTGALFRENDTFWQLAWSGTAWVYLYGEYLATRTDRLALTMTSGEAAALFYETDTNLRYVYSGLAWLRISGGQVNYNVTPVTVNANVTTDQNLMSFSIPANMLNTLGDTLRVWCAGVYSTDAGLTPTLTFKIKFGSTTICTFTTQASDAGKSNAAWNIRAEITTQTIGATGAVEAHGMAQANLTTTFMRGYADVNTATVTGIALNGALTLQVTVAFNAASASNSCSQRQMVLNL